MDSSGNKLIIGICDDEQLMTKLLERILLECRVEIPVEIHKYFSGNDLLADKKKLDVLFLDIDMPQIDGIETGKLFRLYCPDCHIIMATCREERYKEAFYIQAFRFVTKPFSKQEIQEALDTIVKLRLGMGMIEFYENRNLVEIQQREIAFVRTLNSYVEAMVSGRFLRNENSLNEIEKILDNRLSYRIHRQYLINLNAINKYKDNTVYLDKYQLPVARRKKVGFEQAYRKFDITYH